MRQLLSIVMILAIFLPSGVAAVEPDEVLDDPVLESRARQISHGLRCLVCQNQSIDDSEAPLAKDLRILVRERLVGGDSDKQAVQYIVDRYGEFVLLRPRFGLHTLILWIAAPVLLLLGLFVMWRSFRARQRLALGAPVDLTDQELEDLANLLERQKDRPAH